MDLFARAFHCRLSGESLQDATRLFALENCPIAGLYAQTEAESLPLRSPLEVVQAFRSGFVQLAHRLDERLYKKYAFAGGVSQTYRLYLESFADQVADRFPSSAGVMEIGCGDGTLLDCLAARGFQALRGIDPSEPVYREQRHATIYQGFFPNDLPEKERRTKADLIILRHVLEHVEEPRTLLSAIAQQLADDGEVWIEVPDLTAAMTHGLWTNFYQLHCNYFEEATLVKMLANGGFTCVGTQRVDVFGGSLLSRFRRGVAVVQPPATPWTNVCSAVDDFRVRLNSTAARLPERTVGYGAAERTSAALGFSKLLEERLTGIFDANRLLKGRYVAGTRLRIEDKSDLYRDPPAAIVLFAVSHAKEIIHDFKRHLAPDILVAVVSGDMPLKRLADFEE
jgi:predicted TPR repeat methyltransferase